MTKTGRGFRLALAQLDVEPNRPDINVRRMLDTIEQQRSRGADLVVFSEMVVPGYMIGDAFEREAFLRDCEAYNADVAAASSGLTVIWGNVLTDRTKLNRDGTVRKYNAAFAARDGKLLPSVVAIKTHLPTYRQFHDRRHFTSLKDLAAEEGVPLSEKLLVHELVLGGTTHGVGLMLCEDMWWEDYGENIAAMLRDNGASFLINLSASPWGAGKAAKRGRVVHSLFADGSGIPLIYVNNVGFQDIGKTMFAFDGRTAIYDGSGNIVVQAPPYESTVIEVSFDPQATTAALTPARDDGLHEIRAALVYAIRQFMANIPLQNVLIGLSGGIDSSVTAALFVEAIGAERVFGINMPTRFNSARTRTSAERLARNLGIAYAVAPIEESFDGTRAMLNSIRFTAASGAETLVRLAPFDEENVQARIRGSEVLAGVAAVLKAVISCNSNKTEMAFGYATLYGDLIGAIAPIGDLLKGQVYALGREINEERVVIPPETFDTVPSAELSANQNVDEGKGDPFWYDYHDQLVRHFVEYLREPEDVLAWYLDRTLEQRFGLDDGAVVRWYGSTDAFINDLEAKWRLLHQTVFKRYQAPPVVKVSTRAFGFDYHESQVQPHFTRGYETLKRGARATYS